MSCAYCFGAGLGIGLLLAIAFSLWQRHEDRKGPYR